MHVDLKSLFLKYAEEKELMLLNHIQPKLNIKCYEDHFVQLNQYINVLFASLNLDSTDLLSFAGVNFNSIIRAAFLYFQFGFAIFWWKNIGAKTACKMWLKMTTVVNFINILRLAFAQIFFCKKITKLNCKQRKTVQNTFL